MHQQMSPSPVPMTPERERLLLALQILQTVPAVAVEGKLVEDAVFELRQTAAKTLNAFIVEGAAHDAAWKAAATA